MLNRDFAAGIIVLVGLCGGGAVHAGEKEAPPATSAEKDGTELYNAGVRLQRQGQAREELAKYKESLALLPANRDALWNAGVVAQDLAEYDTVLDCWTKLKTLEPDNWRVLGKMVQVAQARGLLKERDAARKELLDLYASGKNEELSKQEHYCREQFSVQKQKVMVFEYFELKGDRALRYAFVVLNDDNSVKYKVSLGSYAMTNAIMKEGGEIKADGRAFHLDGYLDGGQTHETYAMYKSEPTYEEVRETVVDVIAGKAPVLSSSHAGK